jgi:phenylacetate-CoA ligase
MGVPQRDFLPRPELEQFQLGRLRGLLAEILPRNPFHARRFAGIDPDGLRALDDLQGLPLVTKQDLLEDQRAHPPYGSCLTYPLERYCRLHQTSGTSGQPLRWLDTQESWGWMLGNWEQIYRIVGVQPGDRLFFPFSFGPFLGFWTGFESAARLGLFCLPGGGMSTAARLHYLLDHGATVVLSTPTYALHLVEAASREGIDLARSPVRAVIVAGEPGGSIPATRAKIEQGWGARLFDHCGMTEIGPAGVECPASPGGLHILEGDFLAEALDPATLRPAAGGDVGELVLTNLGRRGSPLIRYRTGDLVRVDPRPCPCGRTFLRLDGGIVGRADDMIHLRGNNVHPSTLEAILRRFPELAEYRIEVDRSQALASLCIDVEPLPGIAAEGLAEAVGRAVRDELLFRAEVRAVAPGSLPRYEMKARRVVEKFPGERRN